MYIDTHVHTVASNAINTVYEMAHAAKQRGLFGVAFTEHGPAMRGGPAANYFELCPRFPAEINGVRIFTGCEANILDNTGAIDLDEAHAVLLHWVIAGLHRETPYAGTTEKDHTDALVAALHNPLVDALSHPYRPEFACDVRVIASEAAAVGKAVELNASVLRRNSADITHATQELIDACRQANTLVVIGSDAHIAHELGDDAAVRTFDLDGLRVLNDDPNRFIQYIHGRRKR